jgi:hypothetical protein
MGHRSALAVSNFVLLLFSIVALAQDRGPDGSEDQARALAKAADSQEEPKNPILSGPQLRAVMAAWAFRSEVQGGLLPTEKDLDKFNVIVRRVSPVLRQNEKGGSFAITIEPRYAPGEPLKLHGPSSFGRVMVYVVRIADMKVLRFVINP